MTQEVLFILGIQGSGKSTLAEPYITEGYVRVCRDDIGGTMEGLLPYVKRALEMGKSVVLDNTFMTIESRKPFIELAKAHNAAARCLHLTTSLEDAQLNAARRIIKLEGKLLGPDEMKKSKHPNIFPPAVQFRYRKEFEAPTVDEGFSSVEEHTFSRVWDKEYKNRALILDYDGTVRDCINGNGKYPVNESQIQIKTGVKEILKSYVKKGWTLLGVSNQSGVHKGDLTVEDAQRLFDKTNELLDVKIDVRFCPHQSAPPSCYCRKPASGLGAALIEQYKLNPAECIFVGDMTTDETFAKRCGFNFVHTDEFLSRGALK